jgi:hypothetical protein
VFKDRLPAAFRAKVALTAVDKSALSWDDVVRVARSDQLSVKFLTDEEESALFDI